MELSLVVPAYNEAAYLPALLDSVAHAARQAGLDGNGLEVIVADNDSTDETAEIARRRGCVVAPVAKRMIAAVRNGGAALARGRILAFVDADSRIHSDSFIRIREALQSDDVIGGATGVELDRRSLGICITMALVRPALCLAGIDSGIVFCRSEAFRAVGGYPEQEKVAEDVAFLFALKRYARQRAQRFQILKGVRTLTSARKFDRHGDWHVLRDLPRMAWARSFARNRFDEYVENYWYRR